MQVRLIKMKLPTNVRAKMDAPLESEQILLMVAFGKLLLLAYLMFRCSLDFILCLEQIYVYLLS